MATGKSVKSLSTSRSSLTKAVSTPKTTTTSKVSVPTKTSTISLKKAATPTSSSGSSSSSSAGKSFAPIASASNAARSNITSAVNNAAASKSSTWSSSSAGKSVSSLASGSNSVKNKLSSAVSSRSSWWSSSSKSSWWSTSSNVAKSLSPLLDKEQEMRNTIKSIATDRTYAKPLSDYENASNTNFVNAYNHLRSQGMSDEEAWAAAAGLLENENLLKWKSEEEIAMETQSNNDDEDYDYFNDIINWEEEWEEEEPYYPDFDELFWDYIDRYERRIEDLESQLESNTVKKSVPEERDTSYDYNTYYQENLAPDKMYENWVSKNDLNDKPQVTLVSQYQEPVSTALNDLGLLTPNEAVTNATPNAEEPGLPKGYESWEDIVDDFNNALQEISEDNWLTPQAVAQTYSDFKNQLVQYANTNNMSPEEYKALLRQLQSNEVLREVLLNNSRKWLANRNLM